MRKEKWELWMLNRKVLERDFKKFVNKKIIRKGASKTEVSGHLSKGKRNLLFSKKIIDEFKDFYEWSIIAYYYAVYHAALALAASKGFKTKMHLATIAILIKYFYPKHINGHDVNLLAKIALLKENDIRKFVELKNYREDAAYSISIDYEKTLAETIGAMSIDFVNKCERIIENI